MTGSTLTPGEGTPTTSLVELAFVGSRTRRPRSRSSPFERTIARRDFERWLATVKAEAAAEALEEAANRVAPLSGTNLPSGPTRSDVSTWLNERADRIRRDAGQGGS